jgi:hypothetical protein
LIARCNLCGGDNEYQPGDEMIVCGYCGAGLAIEKPQGPERLVLSHMRKDALAEEALVSLLIEQERRRPSRMATEYALAPFLMIENEEGKIRVASCAPSGRIKDVAPSLPAGNYDYFDETAARPEKVIPAGKIEPGTIKILHLPVYTIRYEAGNWKGTAVVIGESWQVFPADLPPERRVAVNVGILFASIGLFMAYLFLGKIASNLLGRLALIMGASGGGYFLFTVHERMAKRG